MLSWTDGGLSRALITCSIWVKKMPALDKRGLALGSGEELASSGCKMFCTDIASIQQVRTQMPWHEVREYRFSGQKKHKMIPYINIYVNNFISQLYNKIKKKAAHVNSYPAVALRLIFFFPPSTQKLLNLYQEQLLCTVPTNISILLCDNCRLLWSTGGKMYR